MSLIKKSDVKNHLSARHASHIHLCASETQSTATSFSAAGPGTAETVPSIFSTDFVEDHSNAGVAPAENNPVKPPTGPQARTGSSR